MDTHIDTTASISSHDSADLFKFVVEEGNGVKGLVDSNISFVPSCFVHPLHEQIDPKQVIIDASPYLTKPIDLSGLKGEEKRVVVDELCGAAAKLGFFQVINHGVPLEVMQLVKQAAHTFFNLSPEKKAVFLKGRTPCPRVVYGTSFLPEQEKSLGWRDNLRMIYADDQEAMQFWPQECRDAVLNYLRATNKMIHEILNTLLKGLGVKLDESTMTQYIEDRVVYLNYYPNCPNPQLTFGASRHSDMATLTILLQDDTGGLFFKVEDKGWIEIPPVEGALVINIGDTLEILSNGRYKSAEHRVTVNSTKARVSVPIFASPRSGTMIGPLLPDKDGNTLYRKLLFGEYNAYYFKANNLGKKSLDYAKSTEDK
ncbi:hypothetical protein AAC387_Pa03g2642 [Persea americana]